MPHTDLYTNICATFRNYKGNESGIKEICDEARQICKKLEEREVRDLYAAITGMLTARNDEEHTDEVYNKEVTLLLKEMKNYMDNRVIMSG